MKIKNYKYSRKKKKKLFRRWEAWIRKVNRIKGTTTFVLNRFSDKDKSFKTDSNSNYRRGVPLVEHLRDDEIVGLIQKFLLDIRAVLTNFDIERKKKIVQSLPKEILLKVVIKNKIKIFEIVEVISFSQKVYLQKNLSPHLPVHERFGVDWYDEEEEKEEENISNEDNFFQKILKLLF